MMPNKKKKIISQVSRFTSLRKLSHESCASDVLEVSEKITVNKIADFDHIYEEHLKIINNIEFTKREIEIISCLVRGKGVKSMASLLSLSARTIETHISNIKCKIGCGSSREGIISFMEKASKTFLLHLYSLSLLDQTNMETEVEATLFQRNIESIIEDSSVGYNYAPDKSTHKLVNFKKMRDDLLLSFKKSLYFLSSQKSKAILFRSSIIIIIIDIMFHIGDVFNALLHVFHCCEGLS